MWVKIAALLMVIASTIRVASADLPVPPEYYGNTTAKVVFMEPREVNHRCGNDDPLWIIYACAYSDKRLMILPNPCDYPESKNTASYAYLVCHEKAHLKGWKHP